MEVNSETFTQTHSDARTQSEPASFLGAKPADVTSNVMAALLLGAAGLFLKFLWGRLKRWKDTLPSDTLEVTQGEPVLHDSSARYAARSDNPHEKLTQLLQALSKQEAANAARKPDGDSGARAEALEKMAQLRRDLRLMAFLDAGDQLDGHYRLIRPIASGRSVLWLANDLRSRGDDLIPSEVVIKFLPYPDSQRPEVREWFFRSARLLREARMSHAPQLHATSDSTEHRSGSIPYYVMDYIDGMPLGRYVLNRFSALQDAAERFQFGIQLTESLMDMAASLENAHGRGLVHGDIHPGNLLIQAAPSGSRPRLFLVDFDCASIRGKRTPAAADTGAPGYAAPEVIEGYGAWGPAADIFSLARVIIFIFSGRLPNAYALGSQELIDRLDCPALLRAPLLLATNIRPDERQKDLAIFIREVRRALDAERSDAAFAHWRTVLRAERFRISQTLKFSFYGALVPMLTARPFLSNEPGYHGLSVHLSDTLYIGAFHAVIGSLIWAVFITAGYLFCQSISYRHGRVSHPAAAVVCGCAGFLGGILVALLGAGITNACTLEQLGWIQTPGVFDCKAIGRGIAGMKVFYAYQSHLLWAFPLTGTFTGIGLGLWLNLKVSSLLDDGVRGVVPVPKRTFHPNVSSLAWSVLFVLFRRPLALLWLTLPVWAASIAYFVFDDSREVDTGMVQMWRSAGEGLVHSLAALGLGIGFFRGIAPPPLTRTPIVLRALKVLTLLRLPKT